MSAATVKSFLVRNWMVVAFVAIIFSLVAIPVVGTASYFVVKAVTNVRAASPEGRGDTRQRDQEVLDRQNKAGDDLANSFKVP